eukprot:Em0008g631a
MLPDLVKELISTPAFMHLNLKPKIESKADVRTVHRVGHKGLSPGASAFDLKVIHPLNTDLILEASLASGNSAECGEVPVPVATFLAGGRLIALNKELLPCVSWYYGSHTSLWHPMGQISSQSGVQEGDPLGPMLFALVLHRLVTSIDADDDCLQLLLEAWYLDDGVLAGERSAVICALHLIEDLGPHLGLYINFSKCELFSRSGAPIGDFVHCSRFIGEKCAMPKILLKALVDVSTVDLHVAFLLLRMCGSCCKLEHLARATPPSHSADYLKLFDEEVIMQPPADMVVMWLQGTITCGISLLTFATGPIFLTCLGGQLEVGGGTEADGSQSRPADYLVPNWSTGKPAAFYITVTSPLNPISLPEVKVTGGSAARMAEMHKHTSNDPKCRALGQAIPKPKMLSEFYSRLNMSLVRSVARAIMRREAVQG